MEVDDDDGLFYNPSLLDDLKKVNLKTTNRGCFVDGVVEHIYANNHRVSLATRIGELLRDMISDLPYVTYLASLDASTVELLCVESPNEWGIRHAKDVLSGFEGIRTLVLSDLAVASYITALDPDYEDEDSDEDEDEDEDTDSCQLCPALDTLVVYTRWSSDPLIGNIVEYLHSVAQRRKDRGIPFKSVSLFVLNPWNESIYGSAESCAGLEQLRRCVEKLEIFTGDDAMDWDVDDYFFGGLEVRRDRHIFPCQRSDGLR
jgi:hypothetical protein